MWNKKNRFSPKEKLQIRGDDFQEIYFILDGEIELSFEYKGRQIARYFEKGYYFGDYHILNEKKAEYTYMATSIVNTLVIQKDKFLDIMNKYPQIKQKIAKNAFKFYNETTQAMVDFVRGF